MMNINGKKAGRKSRKNKRMASTIFAMALLLSLAVGEMGTVASASYLPAPAGQLVPSTYGNSLMPVEKNGSGGFININIDSPDSDVYWQNLANGKWRGINYIRSYFYDDVCRMSPNTDGLHHYSAKHTEVQGQAGMFYTCDYCGKSAGEVLETAYADYTETLPGTLYSDSGTIYIEVPLSSHRKWHMKVNFPGSTMYGTAYCAHTGTNYDSSSVGVFTWSEDTYEFTVYPRDGNTAIGKVRHDFDLRFTIPVTGYYEMTSSSIKGGVTYSGESKSGMGTYYPTTSDFSTKRDYSNVFKEAGSTYTLCVETEVFSDKWSYVTGSLSSLYIPVKPVSIDTSTTYNLNTRAASIAGDYGIMGDDNTLTKIDSQSIVNETDNSVYNPVTNTTTKVTSWDYDYSDRSYNLTLESGDTMTVTYGDEYVTMKQGDTITNIYYLVQSDDTAPDTPDHTHEYTSEVTKQPTCTDKGVTTYTCTAGDSTYTEAISALGHNWELKQEVATEYDENGELVTQGYKIYKCSRCGEEYRSEDGTSPPAVVDDNTDLSTELLHNKLLYFFKQLPQMLGELPQFLHDAFVFVPDEVVDILEFGVFIAVLVGIFKLLFR